MKTHNLTTQLN